MHPSTRRIETTPTVKGVGPTHRMGPTRRMGLLLSSFLGLGLALALAWALLSQPAAEAQITEPHIRLEKNDDYYDAASVVITQATSLFIDQDEAWTRYQAGELDTIAPPGSALETIKGSPVYGPQLHAYPRQCTYYFGFSHDVPPFDDPLVRAAFASAIDRRRLISEVEVLTGDEFPALTLAPLGTFGYVDGYAAGIGHPYSPTLAQDLLAASGYTGIPTITLLVNTSSHNIAMAEAMRDMWIDTLGITVNVEDLPWRPDYWDLLRDGSPAERPGVFRMSWCADYPDAHNWHSGANSFWLPVSRYENPAYDALVAAAAAEADPSGRLALYEQAEATLVVTDTAILPLYYYVNHRLTRPDLDRTYRPFGGQHLDEWSFTGDVRPLEVARSAPDSLDPALALDWNIVEQLFLGLTDFDEDGNVVPELATGWEVSGDGQVYTFTMRSDADWTDGSPVTAHDVAYGVLRSLDPATGASYYASFLHVIENARAYNEGEITDPDLVGVEALDATHVRFTLDEPAAYFPVIAGLPPARPQPQSAIETYGCGWTAPEHILTNGPYELAAWEGPPYLTINTDADGDPIAGETFVFHIAYRNAGASAAPDTVITDTIMGGIYISDTSSFAQTGSGAPGDPLVWDLGSVPAHSCAAFDVHVQITAYPSSTVSNGVQIATSDPDDQGQSWEKESEFEGHVRLSPLALAMRVNYGHEWVEGDYEPGHTLWLTVTESDGSTIKATAELQTQEIPWWGGRTGYSTNLDDPWVPGEPDIVPGDYVHGLMDNGYASTVRVGTINGNLDLDADTIAGTIHAPWFTQTLHAWCGVWEEGGPWQDFGVDPDGGSYFCDFGAVGWDLLPGHDVGVTYEQRDGGQVINVFEEPAPDMRVEKWAEGDQVAPNSPVVFTIRYRNDGDAVAQTILLTDTLPLDTAYVADSSGAPANVGEGQVSWTLGPLAPHEEREFQLVLTNIADPGDTLRNAVDIYVLYDSEDWNNHAEAEVDVAEGQPDLRVDKHAEPNEPAPGQTFLYEIDYGNDGPVPSGPVVLTDTLPLSTTVVSWTSEEGYGLWSEAASGADQLVLTAPTIPGQWGDRIYLRLAVDPGVSIDTELTNFVEISTAGDSDPGNNQDDEDARVSEPRWDGRIDKDFGSGQLTPGGKVRYNLHIRNEGNMATVSTLTDTLPTGTSFDEAWLWTGSAELPFPPDYVDDEVAVWELGLVEPGQFFNLNVQLNIDGDIAPGTVLNNCAEIAIDGDDDWTYNDAECVVDTVRQHGPNLRVYKELEWDSEEGDRIEYEIHFENLGSQTLYDVAITDTLPASTSFSGDWWHHFWEDVQFSQVGDQLVWTLSRVEPDWSSQIKYRVDLDGEIVGTQGLSFTNAVEAPVPDDVYPADNDAQATATTGPDIYVKKWLSGGEPRPGEIVTFTVEFGNQNLWPWDTDDRYGSHLTDTLPAEMTFVSATAPYDPSQTWTPEILPGNVLRWGWGDMGHDSWWRFDLVAQISDTVQGGDVLTNRIEAYGDSPDDVEPDYGNNVFELPITILGPRFEVSKTYESSRVPGTVVTYTVTVTNVGTEAATNVVVTDALPAGLTYGGSDGAFDGSDVSWTFGTMAAHGGTASGWFRATLPSTAGLEIVNDDYGVRGCDQGVSGPAGAPVRFTVESRRVFLPLVLRNA